MQQRHQRAACPAARLYQEMSDSELNDCLLFLIRPGPHRTARLAEAKRTALGAKMQRAAQTPTPIRAPHLSAVPATVARRTLFASNQRYLLI